ncbi:MAG: hypothetical protein ACR2KV_04870 [Solirubrobacteraceae bacterium]
MPSPALRACLHAFAEQAAVVLAAARDAGSEVGFDVVQEGGRGSRPALYCYRALTGEFIERHRDDVRRLPGYHPAIDALAGLEGVGAYLDARGVERPAGGQRPLADAALRRFLERLFEGGSFGLTAERFEPAYRELEQAAVEGRADTVVVALIRGMTTESEQVPLGDGAILAPLPCLEDLPPDPAWSDDDSPSVVLAIAPGDGSDAVAATLDRLYDMQTAMRLFAPGIGFSPLAWMRSAGSAWRPLVGPVRGRGGGAVVIAADQEDELRAFCNLIARRRPIQGELAWALERFELGCEQENALVALTDHLLALRALLEPEGGGSGRLASRLAALCAVAAERQGLVVRVEQAILLEQAIVAGLEPIPAGAIQLSREVEGHLRALLRDVICGHLALDLTELADELLGDGPAAGTDDQPQVRATGFPPLAPALKTRGGRFT